MESCLTTYPTRHFKRQGQEVGFEFDFDFDFTIDLEAPNNVETNVTINLLGMDDVDVDDAGTVRIVIEIQIVGIYIRSTTTTTGRSIVFFLKNSCIVQRIQQQQ